MLENPGVSLRGAGFEATLSDEQKGPRALYLQKLSYGLRNSAALWPRVSPGLGRIQESRRREQSREAERPAYQEDR